MLNTRRLLGGMLVLMVVGGLTSSCGGGSSSAPPTDKTAVALADKAKSDAAAADKAKTDAAGTEAVAGFVKLGLIKRMDLKTGKISMDGEMWEGFELDAKKQIVKVISWGRDAAQGRPQVTLYDSRSGKELAVYGPLLGVKIR